MLPDEIEKYCEQLVGKVISFRPVAGGCINHGGIIETRDKKFFLKWNRNIPGMFSAEAKGLQLLRETGECKIPAVLGYHENGDFGCLVLEYVQPGSPSGASEKMLGRQLARIHNSHSDSFGLDHNNFMGSLSQCNNRHSSFVDFFREERLIPQIKIGTNNGLQNSDVKTFDRLFARLYELVKQEKASLVHGDLWSGNILYGIDGTSVLIDPAVAYSNRNVDLAMTTLFGGFSASFYRGYEEISPFQEGHKLLWDVLNLYPLLIHLNLFGTGYLSEIRQILKQF